MTIIEFSRKASSGQRVMLLALARIWMTVDTSQDCSKGNEDIALWANDALKKLGIDTQNFVSFKQYIAEHED